jgi:hypothetical protein
MEENEHKEKWNIPEEGCDEENGMKANGGNNNGKI